MIIVRNFEYFGLVSGIAIHFRLLSTTKWPVAKHILLLQQYKDMFLASFCEIPQYRVINLALLEKIDILPTLLIPFIPM